MLPPRRMRTLLEQAVARQIERCHLHNIPSYAAKSGGDVSLLVDHTCGKYVSCSPYVRLPALFPLKTPESPLPLFRTYFSSNGTIFSTIFLFLLFDLGMFFLRKIPRPLALSTTRVRCGSVGSPRTVGNLPPAHRTAQSSCGMWISYVFFYKVANHETN